MLLSSNVMRSVILGEMNALIFSLFDNAFMYRNITLVGHTVSPREDNFLLKSENYDMKTFKLLSVIE